MQATRDPVVQAEIENDQPYRSFNRDALEEHDRAMDNLRIERREFIESMLTKGYAEIKNSHPSEFRYLTEAIDDIQNEEFWSTLVSHQTFSGMQVMTLNEIFELESTSDSIVEHYICGDLPQWHAEIHKQVVLLADMALGEV